jgi:hemolysin III
MNTDNDQGLTSVIWRVGRPARTRPALARWLHSVPRHERGNVVTHAIGSVAFTAAGSWLFLQGIDTGSVAFMASLAAYLLTLMATFCLSVLYHGESDTRRKQLLRAFDHGAIYLLIAGTATPFAVYLGGKWGSLLLLLVWVLALAGIASKLFAPLKGRAMSTSIYLAMGWCLLIAALPFLDRFPAATTRWVVAGGVAYTLGSAVYLLARGPRGHAVWHCFVIAGSGLHFVAVATLVSAHAGALA